VLGACYSVSLWFSSFVLATPFVSHVSRCLASVRAVHEVLLPVWVESTHDPLMSHGFDLAINSSI
jgi:hypothetical protein